MDWIGQPPQFHKTRVNLQTAISYRLHFSQHRNTSYNRPRSVKELCHQWPSTNTNSNPNRQLTDRQSVLRNNHHMMYKNDRWHKEDIWSKLLQCSCKCQRDMYEPSDRKARAEMIF